MLVINVQSLLIEKTNDVFTTNIIMVIVTY